MAANRTTTMFLPIVISTVFGILIGTGSHLWFASTRLALVEARQVLVIQSVKELEAAQTMMWKAQLELGHQLQLMKGRLDTMEGRAAAGRKSIPFEWPQP